jgi:hypothetical protein
LASVLNYAKKGRLHRRPEFREETPKEAYAASLLHCDNSAKSEFVQQKGRSQGLPFSFRMGMIDRLGACPAVEERSKIIP